MITAPRPDHPLGPNGAQGILDPAGSGTEAGSDRPRRRSSLAAAVVLTSLVLGGGAGFGGAALWDQTQDDTASSRTPPSATTTVSDQTGGQADESAEEGSADGSADGSVEDVAAAVLPSVVKIDVAGPEGAGSGSGLILSSDGMILTNNHVIDAASGTGQIVVSFADGTSAEATILGADPLTDTAVIQAEGVSDLDAAVIGSSASLAVGQEVVAVGSPFGLDATVTSGIVSALDRPVNVGRDTSGNATTYPAIQTDAAINPGNSGGPLVDMTGAVVGINSSIRTAASQSGQEGPAGSIGLGFAIPIDGVMPIVEQMSAGETPTHARLGIRVSDTEAGSAAGALVGDVTARSTADEGGLAPGDVITQIDDARITGADSLVATIRSYRPGDTVALTWLSGDEEVTGDFVLDSDAE